MNLFRTIVAASSIVLAPVAATMAVPTAAQATPLGCAGGYLTLGAATVTNPPAAALLTAGAATAVIFDQCKMMPEDGVVMDIPVGARCVDINNRNREVPCPSRARVSPGPDVA